MNERIVWYRRERCRVIHAYRFSGRPQRAVCNAERTAVMCTYTGPDLHPGSKRCKVCLRLLRKQPVRDG